MSDRLAVMDSGRVAQCGSPRDVYEQPENAYVADFLGVANLLDVHCLGPAAGGGCAVRLGDAELRAEAGDTTTRGAAKIVVRPERVHLAEQGKTGENCLPGMVDRLVYLGATSQILVRLPGDLALQALVTNADARARLEPGAPVTVVLEPASVRVVPHGGFGSIPALLDEEFLVPVTD
jgi:ABC-type Fe3+/spermidine/putrescine transport system ATPase subunit